MTRWKRVIGVVANCERAISAVTCFAIVLMVFITVVLRYIFKSQIAGMEEMIMTCAFVIYFLGSSVGAYEESEITADMMSLFLKGGRPLNAIKCIRCLAETVLMVIAAYWSLICIGDAAATGKAMIMTKIPYTFQYSVVFVGLGLTALYSLGHAIDYGIRFIRNTPDEKEDEIE